MRTASRLLSFNLLCVMALAACQLKPAYNRDSFLADLEATDAPFHYTALVAPNIWLGPGSTILVNDEMIHLYEFSEADSAREMAADIWSDGASINIPYGEDVIVGGAQVILREPLNWNGPPHMYQRGSLIVVYVGDNLEMMHIMEDILGEQFAGKLKPTE